MSDLTTNENKYDLFKGVLLVDVGAVTKYSLIHISELEITVTSSVSYKDAEQSLKDVASSLGYNCVLNIVRDNYVESTETFGSARTEGSIDGKISKGLFGSYNNYSKIDAETTINSETQVNNCFNIKGTLAIIGKPNPNGESIDVDELSKKDEIILECVYAAYQVYNINYELEETIESEYGTVFLIIVGAGFATFLSFVIGFLSFVKFISIPIWLIAVWNSKSADRKIDLQKRALLEYETNFKNLASNYGSELVAVYNSIPYATIKHIGD
ncbi:hypothetical protein AVANS_0173 [Campylobacter sp. RM5004]|uniref:hypothetical protein n=1 Tax=Campylobacter sp. RM5004 TaxID=1660078 RepID=UPI001EFAA521|nr:hypothetical protein [Campylobacter sp. RM5004]ULO00825.1 hypothetical protein AVANS_0173 [Campylobacter sp. RM5004]